MSPRHTFLTKAHNPLQLFAETTTLAGFCKKLEKQAQLDPNRYDPRKYVGDGFEFFVELLLLLHPCDNRLGVYDYQPNEINDNGVDGHGVNIRLEPCVVQVKYPEFPFTFYSIKSENSARCPGQTTRPS